MALQMTRTDEEAQIRGLIEDWAKAARAKDVAAIFAHYAPDILAFDAIAQLQFKGTDAYRKHWEACMAMCPGPMFFEVHDLDIEARDDLAFGHYLSRCGGTGPDGEEQVGWMRVTFGCRKTNGKWKIAHEHFSAPFDPESGKALFALEP
ncbi:MAG TPA: nuclear transport factor 2 family protein [Geminicoccaceae bacterium]|nr:nuclear transport factor 2 family protein [Geminicoccaceae bacterium]